MLVEMGKAGGAVPMLRRIKGLRDGVVTFAGQVMNARLAELYGRPLGNLDAALAAHGEEARS